MRAPILAAFPPKGQIAMVGDSLTEFAPWSGMFPDEDIAKLRHLWRYSGWCARARAEHSREPREESACDDRHQRLAQWPVGEFDHPDISHTRGGPWGQRRAGLGRIHVMHVRQRPKQARV